MLMKRRYEVDESYWLVRRSRFFSHRSLFTLRRTALTFKWGRVPKIWELSFIDRMKGLEKMGLGFDEILRSTLPQFIGEDPAHVLRTWVGRKARNSPERFTRSVSEIFGPSARHIVVGIDRLTDEASLLENKKPKDPPYKSLLEAIQKSNAVLTAPQLREPNRTTLTSTSKN
jgi:hypothetical protein